ncbi:MAG: alanine dehydrogenase [Anaerovoracaceae bacterium]|jgi:alanine dehydrogenase
MIIGIPKEIKEGEYRVSIIPSNVQKLISKNHTVLVETGAGAAGSFTDEEYEAAGAKILKDPSEVWKQAEMIVKVKEILPEEFDFLEEKHIIMTYIHSANRLPQTKALLDHKVVAFAYEDVKDRQGEFPLLTPMSELAGYVGLLTGVFHLFTTKGGNGKLICGAPGADNVKVVVFGAGNVGLSAARLAVGMGADVTILDTDAKKLRNVHSYLLPAAKTLYSNHANVVEAISNADLVLNAVKWFPGLRILSRDMLKHMKPNSLIVDIDAEPGGAIETSQYSTHDEPVFVVDGIRHIGIPNLPSAVANTASIALSNATIPYIAEVADKGWAKAAKENESLRCGLDFVKGLLTFRPTAEAFGLPYTDVMEAIAIHE